MTEEEKKQNFNKILELIELLISITASKIDQNQEVDNSISFVKDILNELENQEYPKNYYN